MICSNWKEVTESVADACRKAGRGSSEVTVLAVSKTYPVQLMEEGYRCGMRLFGESKVQEAVAKAEVMSRYPDVSLHFIGQIQTNKVKYFQNRFQVIQSVDREDVATLIQKHAATLGITQEIYLQVNIAGEVQKAGVSPEETFRLMDAVSAMPNLRVNGLMMIPPYEEDAEVNRHLFAAARSILEKSRERFQDNTRFPLTQLSMGMSGDFHVAIEEGATMVRIGTAIFGKRDYTR